ncbi:hypothetical protein POX_d05159 [Penicillium oxalicum]|uniref:hypothetical protein n=1 Tax=Penicillium oxalicum TaxID=69781 RepID=UPI0020B882E6|nr:hypothetical protein POX_d05159 [Penicillium oxalicum]KAI2789664.1 hypothetical protein POX_d05159 [Penicillium oxalicum]
MTPLELRGLCLGETLRAVVFTQWIAMATRPRSPRRNDARASSRRFGWQLASAVPGHLSVVLLPNLRPPDLFLAPRSLRVPLLSIIARGDPTVQLCLFRRWRWREDQLAGRWSISSVTEGNNHVDLWEIDDLQASPRHLLYVLPSKLPDTGALLRWDLLSQSPLMLREIDGWGPLTKTSHGEIRSRSMEDTGTPCGAQTGQASQNDRVQISSRL